MKAPLLALLGALLGAAPAAADDALVDEGRRLYRDGLRADGSPLEGRRHAGPPLRGRDIACVQCHRPSGLGTVEGVAIAPAITGRHLFSPGQPRAGRRPRQAPGMTLHDHGFRTRPAYDLPALARAMAEGINPAGQPLDPLMPRYALTAREVEALAAYLGSLGTTAAPGVTEDAIHLATVLAPDAPPGRRQAMLDVLQHCIAEHSPRPGTGRRPWRLHTWTLHGPPSTWPAQLTRHQHTQPVFALVGGIGREWAPVHRFCEAEGLPCLFPNTDAPGPAPRHAIYLSPGVAVEGRVMARYLEEQPRPPRRLVQIFAADDIGRHGAAALAAELPKAERLDLAPGVPLPQLAEGDALALWLPLGTLRELLATLPTLPQEVPVLVSATLGELERRDETGIGASNIHQLRVIHPFDAPDRRLARMVFNLGGWMSGRGLKLARDTERLQGDTWSACAVTARALYTLDTSPSREALLERVEDAYAGATTTAYPRFTLGPGQRYGSKGAYVMRIGTDDRLEVEGEWVVP
ncbi:MAG: c-type cytochrome [Zoogloea sp.]|uniref:cytochrome c/ABC transporter substrate-binding protein n=1 Tax=Zoogloea sp. TaxID=49181 RepID=UPI00260F708A|nr:c-type cytochrome [Zoogloea sp.]MDD3325692.1 c-type cytochrome [Zoogloea sp.]